MQGGRRHGSPWSLLDFCTNLSKEKTDSHLQVRDKTDPSTMKVLSKLMDEVEKEKAELGTIEDGKIQLILFALEFFNKADTEFRSGRADKKTALKFRAASVLMVMIPLLRRTRQVQLTYLHRK